LRKLFNSTAVILLLPLLPIVLGATYASKAGGHATAFLVNVIGTIIGLLIFLLVRKLKDRIRANSFPLSGFGLALIFLSLFSQGQEGVYRWIQLGPVGLNISMAIAPLVLYGVYCNLENRPTYSVLISILLTILHFLQPDAGQAVATALSIAVIFILSSKTQYFYRIGGILIPLIGAAVTWSRPDPLQPVPHVEQILNIMASSGAIAVFGICISMTLLLIPFISEIRKKNSTSVLGMIFLVYFVSEFAMTQVRWFPTPILGAGAAPVIGWYLMFSLLKVDS
jgi:cell division protein FtsW (lipid II flippase)